MEEQIPDFILNLGENQRNEYTTDMDIPDFIQNLDTSESRKVNYLDEEVKTNLGVDFDDSWSSNKEEVKKYVDSLSNEDYQTWLDWKNQGYSLDARKAMMDQKDLLNPTEQGSLKYKINTPEPEGWVYKYIQNLNEGYEKFHPWMQTAEDWLSNASGWLEEKLGKTNLVNKYIDKYDPYSNLSPSQAEQQLNTVGVLTNMVQIPKTLAQMVLNVSEKAVNIFDNIQNIASAGLAEGADLVQRLQGKEPVFNIQYGEDRSNPIGSYIQTIADGLGVAFVTAYPVATYFFSLLGSYDEKIAELEDIVFSEKPEQAAEWLLNQQVSQDLIDIAGLNSKDQESLKEAIADGILLTIAAILHMGGKKLSSSEIVRLHKEAVTQADRFSRNYAKEQMRSNYEMRDAASNMPEGTEVLNDQGKPIAVSTPEGSSFTPGGAIDTGIKGIKGYAKQFKEYMQRFYNNYKKGVTLRNPEAPVGELPVAKPVESVQPKETTEVTEETTEETPGEVQGEVIEEIPNEVKVPEAKKVIKPLESPEATSIGEYIRKISNQITGKKGGMDEALFEKFSTSPDLQSEYVNTIEPYIKANGAENPSGVINGQLESFIDAAKDQLLARRLQNQQIRKNNRQYKIETPVEQKAKLDSQDYEIKQLTKILSKSYKDPEKFLEYLLNLPENKIDTLNELIPDFTKNLLYIKDTLDITKAITSKDLLGKFLQFKSTRGTRNRHYIRKYLYKKLNEAYKKAGIKYNMRTIENMLNQMSEQDLIELEDEMENGNLRMFESNVEFNDLLEKGYTPNTWIKANENIEQIMDSTRPGTNKKTRDYLKEKGVQISLTNERGLRKIGGTIQAAYSAWLDRILMKETENPYKGIVYHEFGHRIFNQLGTTQMMDLIVHIAKRDHITQSAAIERRAEYYRNYLQYNNIDGKKYLTKVLGKDMASKINATMNKTKEEIFDLFDIEGEDRNINQILSDVKHDTPAGKEITSRRPEPLQDEQMGGSQSVRYETLRSIDPNIDSVSIYPYFDQPVQIKFKDGSTQRRDEYRKKLTQEELDYIDSYETDFIQDYVDEIIGRKKGFKGEGNFNYDTLQNEKDLTMLLMDEVERNHREIQKSFKLDALEAASYMEALKEIDPDIIGLVERDGEIYVKYLTESFWERREMADRPGMVEMRIGKAYDYFSDEDFKKLPESLQKKIGERGTQVDNEGNILSKQQEEYFKDSKVRDKNGDLLVVYHGTKNGDFDVYDSNRVGSSSGNDGYFGAGLYFTDDKSIARDYMDSGWKSKEDKPDIKIGYLNIKKMFNFDKVYTKTEYENLLKELDVTEKELPASEYNGKYRLMNGYDFQIFENNEIDLEEFQKRFGDIDPDDILQGWELTEKLIDAGYDGSFGNNGLYDEYVIFNSNQFKSVNNKIPTSNDSFSEPVHLDDIK